MHQRPSNQSFIEKNFFPGEKHLRKPFMFFLLICLPVFACLTVILFWGTAYLSSAYPGYRADLSMLNALILPLWFFVSYRFFKHYDEMHKMMLLKAMTPATITCITLLLASVFRKSIGGGEGIHEALIIVSMTLVWTISLLVLSIKNRT